MGNNNQNTLPNDLLKKYNLDLLNDACTRAMHVGPWGDVGLKFYAWVANPEGTILRAELAPKTLETPEERRNQCFKLGASLAADGKGVLIASGLSSMSYVPKTAITPKAVPVCGEAIVAACLDVDKNSVATAQIVDRDLEGNILLRDQTILDLNQPELAWVKDWLMLFFCGFIQATNPQLFENLLNQASTK